MRRYTALLVAVVLSACSGGGSTTTQTAETTPATTGASSAPATTAAGSPLDTRLDWIADALSRGEVTETEYEATFTSDFLEAVSHDEFVAGLQQLGGEGQLQWSVGEFEEREDTSAVVLLVSDGGEALRANIVIENVAPYRIAGLLLQPAEPLQPREPAGESRRAAAQLGELGTLELAVYDVTEGECDPVFESGTGDPMPIGSAFKLYVLGALADAVTAGEVAWDNEIAIRGPPLHPHGRAPDERRAPSSPCAGGRDHDAFSDNTGTDHLIALLGRRAVRRPSSATGWKTPASTSRSWTRWI